MIRKDRRHLRGRAAAEPAIGGEAELRKIFARRCNPLGKARHIVNHAQIDARAAGLQFGEGSEECVIAAIKHRDVYQVDAPGRRRDQSIGEVDGLAKVGRRKAWPAAKRAGAEVITKLRGSRDFPRQPGELPNIALDRARSRELRNVAVNVADLAGTVPLDCQVPAGDLLDDLGDFGRERRFIAWLDLIEIGGVGKNARRQYAVDGWKRDLEA